MAPTAHTSTNDRVKPNANEPISSKKHKDTPVLTPTQLENLEFYRKAQKQALALTKKRNKEWKIRFGLR